VYGAVHGALYVVARVAVSASVCGTVCVAGYVTVCVAVHGAVYVVVCSCMSHVARMHKRYKQTN